MATNDFQNDEVYYLSSNKYFKGYIARKFILDKPLDVGRYIKLLENKFYKFNDEIAATGSGLPRAKYIFNIYKFLDVDGEWKINILIVNLPKSNDWEDSIEEFKEEIGDEFKEKIITLESEEKLEYRFKVYSFGSFLLEHADEEILQRFLNSVFKRIYKETLNKIFEINRVEKLEDEILQKFFK